MSADRSRCTMTKLKRSQNAASGTNQNQNTASGRTSRQAQNTPMQPSEMTRSTASSTVIGFMRSKFMGENYNIISYQIWGA